MIDRYVSPDELRRLVSALLVTVGAITIFALFALIVVPGLRNANRPPAAAAVAAPQGETGWLDPTEYPPAKGYELPPIDPQTVLTASPELLDRGKVQFEQNCVPCHGAHGHGDGPAAATLNPRPRDFTRTDGWTNGYHLTEIYTTLSQGIKGTGMTAYEYLSKRDRMALDHYVQSLGAFPHGSDDQTALAALAGEFASAAEKVPNKIPVSMALAKIEAESVAPPPVSGRDGTLFARVVIDRVRAAQTLAGSQSWRQSPAALAKMVVAGTPQNGFAVAAATLSAEDWRGLYAALMQTGQR